MGKKFRGALGPVLSPYLGYLLESCSERHKFTAAIYLHQNQAIRIHNSEHKKASANSSNESPSFSELDRTINESDTDENFDSHLKQVLESEHKKDSF